MKYIVCLWEENLKDYVDIRCYQTYDGSVSINASLDKGFTPEPIWFGPGVAVPTPVPGLYGRVQLGGFFRASGSVQLSATRNFYREGVSGFVYSEDSGFTRINEWKNPPEEDWEASISIDGSLSAGLAGRLQFGLVHEKLASADITLYVGPEISGHAELNATELTVDNNLYSAIKDSEITLSIIADVVPGYQLVGFKSSKVMPEPPTHQDTPVSLKFTWPLNHWCLVPEFDNLKWQADTDGGDLSGDISRNLLPKVALGWVLYDENDNIYKKEYFNESYRKLEDWPHQGLSYHLDNVNKSTTYRAYPLVSLMGVEMRADKSVDVCVRYPVKITDFEHTDSHYEKVAFTNNGQMYSYKFDCAVTVELTNGENAKDWGYVYEDPYNEIKHISLKEEKSPYTDTSYAFYRNEPVATATLYGYVKYIGDDNYYYGEKKDYDLIYDKRPQAETLDPTEVNETSAKVKCGYHEVAPWAATCGIEYWEDTNVNDATRTYFETASDEIEIPINSLKPNTVYYYQALIKVDKKYFGVLGLEKEDIFSDEIKTFTTKSHVVISSCDAINVKTTSATLTGTVEGYDPADESIKFAFMYSNESDLAISPNGVTVPAQYDGNGNLTAEISGLSDFTTYYYTFAIKRGDAAYETSEVKSFKTLPVVTTLDNATTSYNSATLQGTCSKGITTAGFAIKKDGDSESATYSASVDENGNFSATIDGLSAKTEYTYRAFVKDGEKTYWGEEYKFTTQQSPVSISTGEVTGITSTGATLSGTVENYDPTDGTVSFAFFYHTGEDVLNGKSVAVTYDVSKGMMADVSNLSDYTTYYYALAIKRGDASYETSEVRSFKTLPIVTTLDNVTTTYNSATLQGSCSKGITTAGFAIKKDGDSESVTYSASVDANGNFNTTIDGLDDNTTYKYYAFIQDYGQTYKGTELSFTTNEIQLCPDGNHPHMIDLGLPSGTKWSCCNVGASKPDDYGGYYTVGEAFEKDDYSWSNYTYALIDLGENISGTSYDVAHNLWGGDWVTPTKEQLQELIDNTSFKATFINGIFGGRFINTEGKSIFLPAGGFQIDVMVNGIKENIHEGKNERGTYWTSTQYAHRENDTDSTYEMDFSIYGNGSIQPPHFASANNFWGLPIRACTQQSRP